MGRDEEGNVDVVIQRLAALQRVQIAQRFKFSVLAPLWIVIQIALHTKHPAYVLFACVLVGIGLFFKRAERINRGILSE